MESVNFKNSGVQTIYRENDAQTIPWEPPYKVKSGHPEVLELDFLQWGVNLPASRHEIDLIEFLRKKKAWEKYTAEIYSPSNAEFRRRILSDLERSESNFREKALNEALEERMRLAREQLLDYCEAREERFNAKVSACKIRAEQEKRRRLREIECKKKRELRKLYAKENGIDLKYRKQTPVEEFCDPKSDFYVNKARFGQNPRYKDEKLLPECYYSSLKAFFKAKPKGLVLRQAKKATHKTHNCDPVLEEVSSEELLTAMRKICPSQEEEEEKSSVELLVNLNLDLEESGKSDLTTIHPLVPREVEKCQEAALLIQSVIRGRAVQCLVVKGRRKQQDLIDEIKSTHSFIEQGKFRVNYVRALILKKLRQYHYYLKMIGQVAYVNERLVGSTLSSLADIAYKEMERIEGERRAHKMAAWAEQTRTRREAAEGGRRQKEQRLRVKHDEYFKHVMRKTEITTETYLKLLKKSAVFHVSKKEADHSAKQKADLLEKEADAEMKRELDALQRQEISARLLHDFYLPRFTRQASRRRHEENTRKSELIANRLVNRQLENVFGDDSRRRKETHLIFSDRPNLKKAKRPALTVCKCKRTSDIREQASSRLRDLRKICSISSLTLSEKNLNELLEDAKNEHEKALKCKEKLRQRIHQVKKHRGLEASTSICEEDPEMFIESVGSPESSQKESPLNMSIASRVDSPVSSRDDDEFVCPLPSACAWQDNDSDSLKEDDDSEEVNAVAEVQRDRRVERTETVRGYFPDEKILEMAESVAFGVVVEAETRHYVVKAAQDSIVEKYVAAYLETGEEKPEEKRMSAVETSPRIKEDGGAEDKESRPPIVTYEREGAADKWNEKQLKRALQVVDEYSD